MRKWIFLGVVLGLFSCQQQKSEIARLTNTRDSLVNVSLEKDSAIMDFISSFNEIQANLDSIKNIEKLVSVATQQPGELKGSQKQQILEDIALLNQLIQRNKELNADLKSKLAKANLKVGELQGLVSGFEKMVNNLNVQVEQKDREIIQLNQDVENLNLNVNQLAVQVQQVQQEVAEKTEIIERQTVELNTVYYAMGTVKELTDSNILEKSGGVLGLGRTLKIRKDFNREYFTETDMRQFIFLPVMSKKARVVTVHPASSYRISGEKTADTLFVNDSAEFWKASRYLLVVVD